MFKVKKGDLTYILRDEVQLSAFLNSGYELVVEEEKKTRRTKKED